MIRNMIKGIKYYAVYKATWGIGKILWGECTKMKSVLWQVVQKTGGYILA